MLENFVFDLGRRHRPDADAGNTIVMQNRQYIFACLFDRSNIHNALPVIRHAPGEGSCYVVAVGGGDLCVIVVDKAGFNEDGGPVVGGVHNTRIKKRTIEPAKMQGMWPKVPFKSQKTHSLNPLLTR